MAGYLFFDDNRLLVREGFEWEVGKPRLLPDTLFSHDGSAMSGAMARVWQKSENSFHLFYQVFMPDGSTPLLQYRNLAIRRLGHNRLIPAKKGSPGQPCFQAVRDFSAVHKPAWLCVQLLRADQTRPVIKRFFFHRPGSMAARLENLSRQPVQVGSAAPE